jgi:transposase
MAIGRPTKPLEVTQEEKEKLTMLARRPKSAQALAMRARIVLSCEEGFSNGVVAKKLHITGATVCKWRERFRVNRLEGLFDEPRPGTPRSVTDAQVEEVVTKTLESMPDNSTHWSTRLMAQKTGLTQTAIVRIWRAFGLQPHRVENFKFSKDPQFVEKVRDIVGLYLNPPDRAIVLCVDEKSQVQRVYKRLCKRGSQQARRIGEPNGNQERINRRIDGDQRRAVNRSRRAIERVDEGAGGADAGG